MPFGLWDYVLIVGVAAQAAVLAYMYDPRWKALTLAFPIPFTIACLAVGQSVGPTNVFGLVLLMGFIHGVRILHYNVRLPIVPAIALGAGAYCAVGWWLAGRLPTGDVLFWPAALAVTALGATAVRLAPRRREHGHRTGLPLHLKLPMIVAVVVALVMMKSRLQGFMTVFPMVTVIAAYEARKCLWIICRERFFVRPPWSSCWGIGRVTRRKTSPSPSWWTARTSRSA